MRSLVLVVSVLLLALPAAAAEVKPQPPAAKTAEPLAARAAKGDAEAQFQLAEMHLKGQGVAQNFSKAAGLYKSAAEAGYAPAQVAYAAVHALGLGVERQIGESYFWIIAAVVTQPGVVRDAAFESLGDVAAQLSPQEKAALVPPARAAWSRTP